MMAGGYVVQKVEESLTYENLYASEENLWSVLYSTGYLTRASAEIQRTVVLEKGHLALTIPNAEIRDTFKETVVSWFRDNLPKWELQTLLAALWDGDGDKVTEQLTKLLRKTISYHDYRADFCHAFLAGIFTGSGYAVKSNREHGEGRSDMVVYDSADDRIAIFEVKYSKQLKDLPFDCDKAIGQIDKRGYAEEYEEEYPQALCYGIAFYKKRCMVRVRG